MSDEDLRRAIEFLVEQQSLYSARLERDQPRLARLEDAFATLVQLARLTDERMDNFTEVMSTMSRTIDEQVKRMIELAEAQAHADMKIAELAQSQAHSDTRLAQLADSQKQTDSRLARLADAQAWTDAKLAESHLWADAKFADLAEAQAWANAKLAELAEAQMKTDDRVNRLIDTGDRPGN